MKLYVKDGILEKVEGDPEQSITKGAMPIRMLSLPEYVYSPYRILHPMKRDPEKRGDDSAWEQCTWDEAYDLICDNVRRVTDEYGSNSIVTFVGTGREAGNWGPTMSCRVFNSPNICYMQTGWSCYGPRMACTSYVLGAPYPELDYASQFPDSYDDPRWKCPEVIMIWGKEPLKSNPDGFWGHSIVDMYAMGAKFIVSTRASRGRPHAPRSGFRSVPAPMPLWAWPCATSSSPRTSTTMTSWISGPLDSMSSPIA